MRLETCAKGEGMGLGPIFKLLWLMGEDLLHFASPAIELQCRKIKSNRMLLN